MDTIDYILDGLEKALALEAELGARQFEFDRSLLSPPAAALRNAAAAPVPAPAAAARPQVQSQSRAPSAAPAPASAPAVRRAAPAPAAAETPAQIALRIASCTACPLAETRRAAVPGQGCADAPDVMFAGDFPGEADEASGLALSGPAGDFFDRMLSAMHLSRDRVFVTSVCKCRPAGGASPSPACQKACIPHLMAQIAAIRPRCVVVLTRPSTALAFPAPRTPRGRWYRVNGTPAIVTLHPAYIARFDSGDHAGLKAAKTEIWNVLKSVMRRLGSSPAQSAGS